MGDIREWSARTLDGDPANNQGTASCADAVDGSSPSLSGRHQSRLPRLLLLARPDLNESTAELLRSLCLQATQTISRLQLQKELSAIALYDPLTGFANRALLRNHITSAVTAAAAHEEPLALIFVDLDDYKSVNDELDHTAGDTVLKVIATRLTATSSERRPRLQVRRRRVHHRLPEHRPNRGWHDR